MITEPKLEPRDEQPYVAIRAKVTMKEMSKVPPQLLEEVFAWMGKREIEPAGPPLLRFLVIDMMRQLEIEAGVPVAAAVSGDDRVQSGILPAGTYATLIYTGVRKGIEANAALQEWAAKKGIVFQTWEAENGQGWGSRVEFYLTDPDTEPDKKKWQTEVAYLVAEASAEQ
jgi:effector-binding domain-containing protein